jgi:hypothetical protein
LPGLPVLGGVSEGHLSVALLWVMQSLVCWPSILEDHMELYYTACTCDTKTHVQTKVWRIWQRGQLR